MKIVMTAGGGGHFAPLLALLESLPQTYLVDVIGRKHTFEGDNALSFEYTTCKRLGIPFHSLTTGRLQRKLSRGAILSLLKIPYGFFQSLSILKSLRPDCVVSFGGYVSLPVCFAAYTLRIPVVLHEQTMHAGLANKISSIVAQKIALSWESSKKFFPAGKTVVTGNPLRKNILTPVSSVELSLPKKPCIYITGGSGGAHAINALVEKSLPQLLEKYSVIHQTGDSKEFGDFERLTSLKESLPEKLQNKYTLTKFVKSEDVGFVLSYADLVISRSGINIVTELLFLNKPSLLIPLPHGQKNEQLTNARYLKEKGLGEVVLQSELTPEKFIEQIDKIFARIDRYSVSPDAEQMQHEFAHKALREVIENVYQQTKNKNQTNQA